MKKLKAIILIFHFSILSMGSEDINEIINHKVLKNEENIFSKISFSYGIQFLGPSLSSAYENGATYNRFNSGQDFKGDDTDATGSFQIYHAFSLGYKISKSWKIIYSYTFQDELNRNISYDIYNANGSIFTTNQREQGLSYNNQRINFFTNNLYSNNTFFLMSNFFYELPTTDISKNSDMNYGVGVQPVIGIFSSFPGLYHGLKASIQRDYYKRQEYNFSCGTYSCNTKYQTLFASLSGYLGYYVSDKLLIHSEIVFDWDQKGDEVGTHKFNKNMDDVLEIGPKYLLTTNMNLSGKLQYSLNKLNKKYSAFLLNYSLYF